MKKLRSPSAPTNPETGRFHKHEIPVFDHETAESPSHGFTEIKSEKFLGWEDDDIMVIRYNDPEGIDPNNCIYHAYKKEVDADGNFTGNASAIEKIQVSEGIKKRRKPDGTHEMVEEFRNEPKPHILSEVFAKSKLHKRIKP